MSLTHELCGVQIRNKNVSFVNYIQCLELSKEKSRGSPGKGFSKKSTLDPVCAGVSESVHSNECDGFLKNKQ